MRSVRYARTKAGVVHLIDCAARADAEHVHEWAWARGKTPDQINDELRATGLDSYLFCQHCLPSFDESSPPPNRTDTP